MYSVELNIGSLTTPVLGGGWVVVTPNFEKGSVEKALEDNQIFARRKLQGNINFSFDDFDALDLLRLTAAKCDLRVKQTDLSSTVTVIYLGELDLFGTYKENTCILKSVVKDDYTKVLKEKAQKINILNTVTAVKCDVTLESSKLIFYSTLVAQSSLFYTWLIALPPSTNYIYAREEKTYPDYIADELEGSNGWLIISDNGDGTKTLGRTWTDGGFDPVVSGDLSDLADDFSSYSLNDIIEISGEERTVIGIKGIDRGLLLRNDEYYDEDIITYSRFRKLRGVIMELVSTIDADIQFDTSTWTYLQAHEDLKYLLVANVSDLVPINDPPEERATGQEFGELTFDNIMKMLRQKLKLYWKIVSISGVPYFRLVHRSEINYVSGTVNLTAYHGVDWTRDLWTYANTKLFNKLQREVTWDNYDFKGTDILIPALDNIAEPKTVGDDKWHFDIWDIIARAGNFYPNDTKNEFCMLAVEPYPTDGVEKLTTINNVYSSYEVFSYAAGTLIAQNTHLDGLAQTNSFSVLGGYTYRFVMDVTASAGQKPTFSAVGTDLTGTVLVDGENELFMTVEEDGNINIDIINTEVGSFTIEGMSIERYIFRGRIKVGALTGEQVMNAELSVANLDETHARYELPDSTCTINHNVSAITGNRLLKNKEQVTKVPIHSPEYIDEEELFTTNKGSLEFDSLKIPMSGAMPEIVGRFL